MAAACTAGIAPTEAAYSSPHIQSELVTDHLHFSRADSSEAMASGNDGSVPCQAVAGIASRVTVGRGFRGGKPAAGTPALANPSTWPAAGLHLPTAPCREHMPLPDPHLKGPCGLHFLSLPHAHILRHTIAKDQRKSHLSHPFFMCEKPFACASPRRGYTIE